MKEFKKCDASEMMNMIDYIYLTDLSKNQESQDQLHTSRARLDNLYENIDELDDDEREELPEDIVYDISSMDPEYVRKAQEKKVRQTSDLKYVKQTENGFAGLGPAFG